MTCARMLAVVLPVTCLLAGPAEAARPLTVASVAVTPAAVAPGGALQVRATVRNRRDTRVRSARVRLRVTPWPARGAPEVSAMVGPIAAGARKVLRRSLVLPADTVARGYVVAACVRAGGRSRCGTSSPFDVLAPPVTVAPGEVPTAVPTAVGVASPAPAGPGPVATASPTATPTATATPTPTPPPDAAITNRIVENGSDAGAFTLTADWDATDAVLRATAPITATGLGPSTVVRFCLSTHALGAPPVATCEDQTVTAFGYVPATISRTIPRPAAGGTTWATGLALLGRRQFGGGGGVTWTATSWPAAGLADASIVIPDADGVVPGPAPSQGVSPGPGTETGGINTSLPDSLCADQPLGPAPPPAQLALSTTALGALPFHYEVGEPTGAFAGQPPKGIMIVAHGGGWTVTGAAAAASMRGEAERWRARGWRTVNTTYRACGESPGDILALHDAVRATYGPTLPACATGASAGGHLALYLASLRDLYCVISMAGPADLVAAKDQTAYEPATGGQQTYGPRFAYNIATAAFGEENLAAFSPQRLGGIDERVLFAIAESDSLVPPAQADALRDALLAVDPAQYADAFVIPVGEGSYFVHGPIAPAGLEEFHAREAALVAPLG